MEILIHVHRCLCIVQVEPNQYILQTQFTFRVIQLAGKDIDFWGWPVTVVTLKNDIECAKRGGG